MYGYVTARKPDMKIKDFEAYKGFYCGFCDVLGDSYGPAGRLTLGYDMTFLVILLTSVYDMPEEGGMCRCMVHPLKKRYHIRTEASEYAADVNMLLVYYKMLDDGLDEGGMRPAFGYRMYKKSAAAAARRLGRKAGIIRKEIRALHESERSGDSDLMSLASCFGRALEQVFSYSYDERSPGILNNLSEMGFHIGRFIYLMDAWDDMEEDRKNGSFNPLLNIREALGEDEFRKYVYDLMEGEMARASAFYRRLPCLKYREILDNIIYAGVWVTYDNKMTGEKNDGSLRGFGNNKICYGR